MLKVALGWYAIGQYTSGTTACKFRSISDKGLNDTNKYDTGNTRILHVRYVGRNFDNVAAFGWRTLFLAATSTLSRCLHGGRKFAGILQTGRADSLMGVYYHGGLTSEIRLSDREGELVKLLQRRPRCVMDIWSWLHCFGTYVSVLAPFYLQAIPELMAYMSLIIRCSQDYEDLAWVRYNMSFHCQASASGNRNWPEVNRTLYSICFTGKSQRNSQCKLCLAKSHAQVITPCKGRIIWKGSQQCHHKEEPPLEAWGGDVYHHHVKCTNCGTTISAECHVADIHMCKCVVGEITQWWYAT